MDDEFIEEFASNPKICKSMHMPLQSGSTEILKQMKRGYSKEWFLDRAKKLRDLVPNVSISTDIIIGFPGESEEDYQDTLDVMRQVEFEQVFSFKYSPRPMTEAENYTNIVEPEVASQRLSAVQELHNETLDKIKHRHQDSIVEVYFEELRSDGFVAGRSDNNLLVKVKGSEELLGRCKNVKITKLSRLSFEGELIE
jgi:tRNA-2-methylthio-N6-dimethylallyladenosine synthase